MEILDDKLLDRCSFIFQDMFEFTVLFYFSHFTEVHNLLCRIIYTVHMLGVKLIPASCNSSFFFPRLILL